MDCKCGVNNGLISVSAKCSDMISVQYTAADGNNWHREGRIPAIGIGSGDYLRFDLCPSCGSIQDFEGMSSDEVVFQLTGKSL